MAMNPKDFTVEAAKSYLEKEYPFEDAYKNLTEADKIYNEKLANAAREKIKNPSSKIWDSMVKGQKIIGGDKFPLSPENAKALGRAVDDDYAAVIRKIMSEQGSINPSAVETRQGTLKSLEKMTKPIDERLEKVFNRPIKDEVLRSLSYPEGQIAGMAGKALRGIGKVASKVAGPIGAALTAYDLGSALSEVQDKGAAKIAEDYKKEQEIKNYKKEQERKNDEMTNKQYSPEEKMKVKEMLKKYRASPGLRE